MTRRVTKHIARTTDNEDLEIITIYESGLRKEEVKRLNPYNKKHNVLIRNGDSYYFKRKNA
ncbi:hypothetical protein [Niallia sp. 03190]|uniref:hypothetical protein n=1 Tax=Niallia sp. 03190 TaxID=3458061 RepID=UPI00404400B9